MTEKRKCPFPDYRGNPIFEGDMIVHPSGEKGIVIFKQRTDDVNDNWLVQYEEDAAPSRLCLQVGDKGQATVLSSTSLF